MGENKKPDYLDSDWTALIADRQRKWADMLQEYEKRGIKKIPLWEDQNYPVAHVEGFVPGLILYPPHEGEKRGTLVICPGGGFAFKSSNEGKEIAEFFYEKGLNVAILDYSVNGPDDSAGPKAEPATLRAACEDAKRAIRLLRYHAEEWGILPDKIGIGGFSAGGMVTSLLLTHFDAGDEKNADPVERVSCRPDATFQMYGSFRNGLGAAAVQGTGGLGFDVAGKHSAAQADFILHLPVDVPPMFMAQTDADDPANIMDMGRAYYERGVPFEVHLFHGGPHGGGLYDGKHEDAPEFPHTAHWAELAAEWFGMQGF